MLEEALLRREKVLVRRQRLEPGEALPWHRDPFHRVAVVLSGDAPRIEYRDGGEPRRVTVAPGQADWDEPCERVHRTVNVGQSAYEEITVFFLDRAEAAPQPREE